MNYSPEQRAVAFAKELVTAFCERRDPSALAAFFNNTATWININQNLPCLGTEEILRRLEDSQRHRIFGKTPAFRLETDVLAERLYLIYGEVHFLDSGLVLHITFLAEDTEGGMRLIHAHTSQDSGSQNQQLRELKREREALRLSLERHQLIMDQTTDIIFEWDIPSDTLTFSANWQKKFGYDAISREISRTIPNSADVHPEDMPIFIKIMQDTAAGKPYSKAELRLREASGRYLWCRIRATAQYDEDHRPIKAIGVIIDIDAEKRQRQALLEQARRDALTGLYNKTAINSLVEQRMESGETDLLQALMIIDVDNFKAVNDTYGHLCGDSVLSDVAAALKVHTRSTDLVGRIGGDEFLVYLPQIAGEAAARAKAEDLQAAIHELSPENGAAKITCSIGVALFQRGSIDYFALYKCADQALYSQKAGGRGGVTFYDSTVCGGKVPCGLSPTAVSDEIGSDESNVADEQMAQYVFRTLYVSKNIAATLDRLLEIIGRSYDVSRVYIFESVEDGLCCSNTFEWCADGVMPQIEVLQNISYHDNYVSKFNEDGVFYCRDIKLLQPELCAVLEPQGIRSMLQCSILDEGEFRGFVGFDEIRENRSWNDSVVASFKLIADVLSMFVLKLRLKQKLASGKD